LTQEEVSEIFSNLELVRNWHVAFLDGTLLFLSQRAIEEGKKERRTPHAVYAQLACYGLPDCSFQRWRRALAKGWTALSATFSSRWYSLSISLLFN
jgi:hypothetical protein